MKGKQRWIHLCYLIVMLIIGVWYSTSYADFGKAIVGSWGVVVSCLAVLGGIDVRSGRKKAVVWYATLLTALQVFPVCCWGVFVTRQFAGIPGWLGLTAHVIMFVWGIMNIADSIRKT